MIIQNIYFHCYGCQDYNKHNRDDDKFEAKQTRYDSLRDAIQHIAETEHDMHPRFEEYEEEE